VVSRGRALPQGKDLWFSLDKRLGGIQSCSGHRLEEESFTFVGNRTTVVQSVVDTILLTELPQISNLKETISKIIVIEIYSLVTVGLRGTKCRIPCPEGFEGSTPLPGTSSFNLTVYW
jgi:hypothetical protein